MTEANNIDQIGIKYLPWQIIVFMIVFILPVEVSFYLGGLRLTPYRIVLLLTFVPCLLQVFKGQTGKVLATDWLLLGYVLWIILSLSIHEGWSIGLESGGILLVESYGAYLLARSYIRSEREFSSFVKLFIITVIGLSLFTIPESLTGNNFFRPYARHIDPRFGLERAFGPFEHPILYGVFCASSFALALYVPIGNLWGKEKGKEAHKLRASWMVLATFMSVSSGALATVIVQFILVIWNKITAGVSGRWRLFSFLLLIVYIIIDLLSNRKPIHVLLHRLTFSAHTAYNRLIIWDWGTKENVAKHPWFGIGFGDWVRPSWMHSSSMDNFWLVTMVRYGLPAFFFLAIGVLVLFFTVGKKNDLSKQAIDIRAGWLFSLIGFIIAGCTVHFWNSLYVWFFFLLGSGAWMAHPIENKP